ncbi:hypothetical protein [Daejeonella sp.]|uniref:hypothetical protein n=1 Tax=Daejeonella sp. TaxID=2805397 RepID=UPI003983A814
MSVIFRNSRDHKVLFVISIAVVIIVLLGRVVNVYYFAVSGAIFELINLPLLALLFGLPLYCLYVFWKDRFNAKSLALYSALLLTTAIFLLISLG